MGARGIAEDARQHRREGMGARLLSPYQEGHEDSHDHHRSVRSASLGAAERTFSQNLYVASSVDQAMGAIRHERPYRHPAGSLAIQGKRGNNENDSGSRGRQHKPSQTEGQSLHRLATGVEHGRELCIRSCSIHDEQQTRLLSSILGNLRHLGRCSFPRSQAPRASRSISLQDTSLERGPDDRGGLHDLSSVHRRNQPLVRLNVLGKGAISVD
jgi:hypothetical protein